MKAAKILIIALLGLSMFGCSTTEEVVDPGTIDHIKDWANDDVIDAMVNLGFTIHEGADPPNIEGIYRVKARILDRTNVPDDPPPGLEIFEYQITFFDQDNSSLIVDFLGSELDEFGSPVSGYGVNDFGRNSYIAGSDDDFTVFHKIVLESGSSSHTFLQAFTGTITLEGFGNFQEANFMFDDGGDSLNVLIENNQGRILRDGDGLVAEE